MNTVEKTLQNLKLEQLETLLFRGTPNDWPTRHVFGGHVLAQAIEASMLTVKPEYHLHSVHCYYLRPGIADQLIIYDVDPIREGRSFVTRRVRAIQNGEAIFAMSASFHIGEAGLAHQIDMPDVPRPEDLDDDEAYYSKALRALGKEIRMGKLIPFEMRSLDRMDLVNPVPKDPVTGYWFRLQDQIADEQPLHTRLLAYISDFAFLSSTLRPHAMYPRHSALKTVASVDHAMWFHSNNFRVDEWIYYKTEGYWAGEGRGHAKGALYSQDGRLLASTAQECLLRLHKD